MSPEVRLCWVGLEPEVLRSLAVVRAVEIVVVIRDDNNNHFYIKPNVVRNTWTLGDLN